MIFNRKKVLQLREEQGLTQKQVADACGVAESSVCGWENGTNTPRPSKIPKLAKILHCKESDLAQYGPNIEEIKISDLELFRKRAKLSRAQLAKKIKVPEYKIEAWEKRSEPLEPGHEEDLKEVLALNEEELLNMLENMIMNPEFSRQNRISQHRKFIRGESFREINNEYVESFRQKAIGKIIMLDIDPSAKDKVLQIINDL